MPLHCSACGASNSGDANFCQNCGAKLVSPYERPQSHDLAASASVASTAPESEKADSQNELPGFKPLEWPEPPEIDNAETRFEGTGRLSERNPADIKAELIATLGIEDAQTYSASDAGVAIHESRMDAAPAARPATQFTQPAAGRPVGAGEAFGAGCLTLLIPVAGIFFSVNWLKARRPGAIGFLVFTVIVNMIAGFFWFLLVLGLTMEDESKPAPQSPPAAEESVAPIAFERTEFERQYLEL
ncbi:MAG: zinc ribbon domain-containing protein [bacterium]|jgi:hypothetical protein